MTNPITDKPDFKKMAQHVILGNNGDDGIDTKGLYLSMREALQAAYQQGMVAGEAAAVKRSHALSELMVNKQRPEIKPEVIAGLREMAEAHHAMAENTQDKLEAAALNAMLDWYEAGR